MMKKTISEPNPYCKAIKRYIAQREPATDWPQDREDWPFFGRTNPCIVANLPGVPGDYLPLYFAKILSSAVLVGITPDTKILTFQFRLSPPYKVFNPEEFAKLEALFANRIDTGWNLNAIRVYKKVVGDLRNKYPEIAPLFPDTPDIPPHALLSEAALTS
jgi:hypothetical protein